MRKKTGLLQPVILALCFLLLLVFLVQGCASGPSGQAGTGVLRISLKVSDDGEIDTSGRGYYGVLFNSRFEPVEVTNFETFTDFVRFDGMNFTWYHRQGNVPSPGYTWVEGGNVNAGSGISSDGKSIVMRMNIKDSNFVFNQYIEAQRFSVHAVTTDSSNSLLGRLIDTLGQGPSISGNSLHTIYFDRGTGIVSPTPPGYPGDPLRDYDVKGDLGDFPYDSYDIESFTVELE